MEAAPAALADSISLSWLSYLQYKIMVVKVANSCTPELPTTVLSKYFILSVACIMGQMMLISGGGD